MCTIEKVIDEVVPKKEEGGYFTIEAAMIGSLTCFLVFCIMVAAMYCYDLGVASSYVKETAAWLSVKNTKEKEQGFYQEELEKRLIFAKVLRCNVQTGESYVKLDVWLNVHFPVPIVGEWIGNQWKNQICVRMEAADITEKIRGWKLLE